MEKKNNTFDALLQRKQKLMQKKQELLSLRLCQSNDRLSPEESKDVKEMSDNKTYIKQTKVHHNTPTKSLLQQPEAQTKRLGMHAETPFNQAIEEAETPTKRLRTRSATPVKQSTEKLKTPITQLGIFSDMPKKRQTNPPKTPSKRFKTSSATLINHSVEQLKNPMKPNHTYPGTPIKYLKEQQTTPLKQQLNQQRSNAGDNVNSDSSLYLPLSHNYFTPDNSPLRNSVLDSPRPINMVMNKQLNTRELAVNAKKYILPFLETRAGPKNVNIVPSGYTTTVPDVYSKALKIGLGNSTAAPAIISQEIYLPFADAGTGPVTEVANIVTTSAVHDLYSKALSETGYDAAAVVEINPGNSTTAAPAIISQEIYVPFSDTGPGLTTEAVTTVTTSAYTATVPDVYSKEIPETGFDLAAVVEIGPVISNAAPSIVYQEMCAPFADTGPGLTTEAVTTVTTSAFTATVPDVYSNALPETGFDAAAVVGPSISNAAPEITSQEIYVPFSDTGPGLTTEAVTTVTTSAFTATVPDVYSKALPETGFDAAAVVGPSISNAAPEITSQEIYVPFSDTGPGLTTEAVTTVTTSAYTVTVPDLYSIALPETGFDSATIVEIGPGISNAAPAIMSQEIYVPFEKTGPGSGVDPEDKIPTEKIFCKLSNTPLENHDAASNANLTTTQKRRKRRQAVKQFRKSCMDFQSEEEMEDFSAGSSDLWTGSESNVSSDDSDEQKKKKKKKKSKTLKNNEQCIKINKKNKRINIKNINKKQKDKGKLYSTRKGKTIEEKSIKVNPCVPEKCKRGCYDISDERRTSIFTFFWKLDVQRRRDWLVHCARAGPIRRKRTDSTKRNLTYDYYINDGEDHKKVCQKFLLDTLDITQRFLLYTLYNENEGMSQEEKRTRSAPDKYSESAKVYVHTFIEKLPACPSHYNRKKSKRMYLQQGLKNLSNLFRIYVKECELHKQKAVSENIFRRIFNEDYDLGFHTPKKDKCILCTKAETFENEMTENDKEKLKKHLEEKEAMYNRFKAHQTLKDVNTLTCSFDLQKVLNTPYGESMLLYYSRKYAVFNFTIYESITQNVTCFTWGECDGKRGGIEIASCLYSYLKELDKKEFKNVLLYCDSCTGQNKNKIVLSVLNYFLHDSKNLQVIQINYLLPGHTYMPADSVHATIEAEVKKLIVWSPSQWPSYFESARKRPGPYSVTCMEHTDFIKWEELATKTFTKETVKNIKFKEIRVATFKKKNLNQMEIKYSMKDEALNEKILLFQEGQKKVKGKGKGKGKGKKKEEVDEIDYKQVLNSFTLLPKYSKKLPISASKYTDLKKLCSDGTIPKRYHREFQEMPYDGKMSDALVETDEEDEVTSEVEEENV